MPPLRQINYLPAKDRATTTPTYTPSAFREFTLPGKEKEGGGPLSLITKPLSYIPKAMRAVGNVALDLISDNIEAKVDTNKKTVSNTYNEVAPVVFGEVGNRGPEKTELEARVILTTAVNRKKEYAARGMDKTLDEILAMPNQYQAYKGKEYNKYKEGTTTEPDKKKKKEVDEIVSKLLKEIEEDKFKPVSSAYYYIHNPDGTITFDDERPLFK